MSSLRDVARRAGVSVATASRVASGGNPVRPETRERVERAMRELLYVPPGRKPATGLIGVLVPELTNPIFPALAQAIETRAAPSGLASILCNTREAAFREVDYVHMLLDRRVEGMIFISCEMTNLSGDHDHYAQLLDEGARLVFVNGALNQLDVPSVGVDERAAGEIATQHLLDLGHERIGFVAGPEHYLPTHLKGAGREQVMRAAGLDPGGMTVHADFSVEGGKRAIAELLALRDPPTGVICSSDLMAIGVAARGRAARRRRSRQALGGRLRRHRRDDVDRPRAHDRRAADRADRRHRGADARHADRGPVAAVAELVLPAGAARARVDRAATRTRAKQRAAAAR